MTTLVRNSSPGALTLNEAIELEKKRNKDRRKQMRQARELAAQGRGGDTEVAHVAPGELVVPQALQTPELLAALRRVAAANNIPFDALRVGSTRNSVNPQTGAPEFGLSPELEEQIGRAADIPININPIDRYPVPDFIRTTPPRPEIGQGNGDFMSRKDGPHRGVDFAVPPDQPIYATADGVVKNTSNLPGYGNQIAIEHDGGITTQVAHVGRISVKPGEKVTAGQIIGISGDGKDRVAAGNAYGLDPQVHYEVRGGNGRPHLNGGTIYNPFDYLPPRNPRR